MPLTILSKNSIFPLDFLDFVINIFEKYVKHFNIWNIYCCFARGTSLAVKKNSTKCKVSDRNGALVVIFNSLKHIQLHLFLFYFFAYASQNCGLWNPVQLNASSSGGSLCHSNHTILSAFAFCLRGYCLPFMKLHQWGSLRETQRQRSQ